MHSVFAENQDCLPPTKYEIPFQLFKPKLGQQVPSSITGGIFSLSKYNKLRSVPCDPIDSYTTYKVCCLKVFAPSQLAYLCRAGSLTDSPSYEARPLQLQD